MTLYEFNDADELEQIEAFWNGVIVGKRSDGEFTIECRQIDDFYVEYKLRGGQYTDMHSFKDTDMLQPYLDQMGSIEF